jgi:hypothetical protein
MQLHTGCCVTDACNIYYSVIMARQQCVLTCGVDPANQSWAPPARPTYTPSRHFNSPKSPAQALLEACCVSADPLHAWRAPVHTAQAPADTCCMHTGLVWVTHAARAGHTAQGECDMHKPFGRASKPRPSRAQALQAGTRKALLPLLHCHKAHNTTPATSTKRSDKCMLRCILLLLKPCAAPPQHTHNFRWVL